MSHFMGQTALLITGICHLHLSAVAPQSMGRNHSGVSPAYVGLGRFQFNVIHTA